MIRGAFQTSVSEDEPDRPSRERDGSINSQHGALPRQTVDVAKLRIDSPKCRPNSHLHDNSPYVRGHNSACHCPFRKLNPAVLMVKSAQNVASDDAAAALNGSAMWGIFLQAEMGPCRVVIRSVFLQDAPKMGLAPHDHVVKTLTSDRADCALDMSVLPWRSRRDRAVANAHRPNPPREHRAISAVVVADEKGRGRVPWKGFGDLMGQPLCRRVRGDADP